MLLEEFKILQQKYQQKCQRESQMMQELAIAQNNGSANEHKINVATAEKEILAEQLKSKMGELEGATKTIGDL